MISCAPRLLYLARPFEVFYVYMTKAHKRRGKADESCWKKQVLYLDGPLGETQIGERSNGGLLKKGEFKKEIENKNPKNKGDYITI